MICLDEYKKLVAEHPRADADSLQDSWDTIADEISEDRARLDDAEYQATCMNDALFEISLWSSFDDLGSLSTC